MKLGPGFTFSWRRAIGLTGLLQRVSRRTGVPFTRQGRERKVGALIFKALGRLFGGGR
jgi:hypothetical protein